MATPEARQKAEQIAAQLGSQVTALAEEASDRLVKLVPKHGAGPSSRWAWPLSALAAFGLGVVVGILAAPRRGEETRSQVKDKVVDYSKGVRGRLRAVRE